MNIDLKPIKVTKKSDYMQSFNLNLISATEIIRKASDNLKQNKGSIVLFSTAPIIIQRIKLKMLDKVIFMKILQFAIPFLPAGIFTMVMELSDRYLLEWFLGIADVGLYSAGKKMGMLGLTIVMGFNMGWTPYFLKRGQEKGAKI